MPRGKELTVEERSQIVGMVKAGMTMSAAAQKIKRSLSSGEHSKKYRTIG